MTEQNKNAQLKNRILGAILLVILAVLLIPEFLGEPKKPGERNDRPNREFQSKIEPLTGADRAKIAEQNAVKQVERTFQAKPKADIGLKVAPKAEQKPTQAEVVGSTTPPRQSAPSSDTAVAKPKQPDSSQASSEQWALQVGIFSKKANADAIAQILKSKGLTPQVTETSASFGTAHRVWIGPFSSKGQGTEASKKLKQATGDGGYIAPYPFSNKK